MRAHRKQLLIAVNENSLDQCDNSCSHVITFLNTEISTIKNKIKINFNNALLIGWGTFGEVYLYDTCAIKTSHILRYINKLIKDKPIEFDQIKIFINEYNNEVNQVISFAYLNSKLPNNFIKIFDVSTIFSSNYDFPLRLIYMEHINGINIYKFISMLDNKDYSMSCFSIVSQLLLILMYANINGFFHNDLNLGNIMIKQINNAIISDFKIGNNHIILENKNETVYVPVIIDYNFSKKIVFTNKYPIDCHIIYEYVYEKILNIIEEPSRKKYKDVKLIFSQLFEKYKINCTPFVEKIITGRGLFSINDYTNLPTMSNEDIDKLSSCFIEMYNTK